MESNKLPNNLSNDELEALLKNDTQVVIPEPVVKNISLFLTSFKITPGTKTIGSSTLYALYKHWSKNITLIQPFITEVSMYVEYKNGFFLINLEQSLIDNHILEYVASKSTNRPKSEFFKKQFDQFLIDHDIKEGKEWVKVGELFPLYHSTVSGTKLGKINFIKICKLYFTYRTYGGNLEFCLNRKIVCPEKSAK